MIALMNRMKTLSLPLMSAIFASVVAPATAQQVALDISTDKEYRQDNTGMQFNGGGLRVNLRDGFGVYVGGCARVAYWRPNIPLDPCPLGATAFLSYGSLDGESDFAVNYFSVTSVVPAIIIEPRRPDLSFLRAAPPSKLERPLADFQDTSYSLYYNLHTTNIREYIITRYSSAREYSQTERALFEAEVVPGVYYYSFPRLNNPTLTAPISAVIYPMPEGRAVKNKKQFGVDFVGVGKKAPVWRDGFMELSYNKPNVIAWRGFDRSTVFARADKLYLSIRAMQNAADPLSGARVESIFPGFTAATDPRILLGSPFQTSFTTPPIFPGGTRGILELELQRSLSTTGVTYDTSSRKFQIPVIVVNRYTEYAEAVFQKQKKKVGLLDDFDSDGFNNLNEWILGSSPRVSGSVPQNPVATARPAVLGDDFIIARPAYFGFTISKKLETVPAVTYILERSTDAGVTWLPFESDANWSVTTVVSEAGTAPRSAISPRLEEIRVESVTGLQPAGTQLHRYRVRITTP